MNIECSQEALAELESSFKFNDAVLRHLVVRKDKPESAASPMMKHEKARQIVGDAVEQRAEASTD
jgi:small subunit ribosomal protein S6